MLNSIVFSPQQLKALSVSMQYVPNLNELNLTETNLSDESFAMILATIDKHIPTFRSITYKGPDNGFGMESLRPLCHILRRREPNNMRTLKLEGLKCKMVPEQLITDIFLKSILTELSFANMRFETDGFMELCKLVNSNFSLKDLNIKQINVPSTLFVFFMMSIAKNRTL